MLLSLRSRPIPKAGANPAGRRPARRHPQTISAWATALAALVALAAALALVFVSPPARAAGRIEVNFVQPDRYADIGRTSADRAHAMKSLGAYFQDLATKLPTGQTLSIDVLDVKLAGRQNPFVFDDARILRGDADGPTMVLRWRLDGPGGALAQGEDRLTNPDYFFGIPPAPGAGAFPYEKRMLDGWFADKIARPRG